MLGHLLLQIAYLYPLSIISIVFSIIFVYFSRALGIFQLLTHCQLQILQIFSPVYNLCISLHLLWPFLNRKFKFQYSQIMLSLSFVLLEIFLQPQVTKVFYYMFIYWVYKLTFYVQLNNSEFFFVHSIRHEFSLEYASNPEVIYIKMYSVLAL